MTTMVDNLERGKRRKVKRVLTCCVAGEELEGDKKKILCFKTKSRDKKIQGEKLEEHDDDGFR